MPPRRESGWFMPVCKTDGQCQHTLGELRHQGSSHEFDLKTLPDDRLIPERQVTTRETDLFARWLYFSFLISASGGRDTTTYTVDEDMT